MLSVFETTPPIPNHLNFCSKITSQQELNTTNQLVQLLIDNYNNSNISYIQPIHSATTTENLIQNQSTLLDMPNNNKNTPSSTSSNNHSSQVNHHHHNLGLQQQQHQNKLHFHQHQNNTNNNTNNNQNNNTSSSNSSDIYQQTLTNNNMFSQSRSHNQQQQSNMQSYNDTSISPSTNNPKKRKHEFVNYPAFSENSIHYNVQSDFKRKSLDKKRLVWTNELHDCFVKAVTQLGVNDARPKDILELMNIPDLTTTHIKSHLQKYRQQIKKGIVPTNGESNSSGSDISDDQQVGEFRGASISDNNGVRVTINSKATPPSSSSSMNSGNRGRSDAEILINNISNGNIIGNSGTNQHVVNSLMNTNHDNNNASGELDQVNYIKNILLHFNQLTGGPNQPTYLDVMPSFSTPQQQQHVTIANSITNNNITNVNHSHFPITDANTILNNCHLLTCENSLSEFLILLQQICKTENDISKLFNNLHVQSSNDLNLIIEGFRLGFICGMRFK